MRIRTSDNYSIDGDEAEELHALSDDELRSRVSGALIVLAAERNEWSLKDEIDSMHRGFHRAQRTVGNEWTVGNE